MTRAVIVGCRGQDGSILWDQLAAQGASLVGLFRGGIKSYSNDWNETVQIEDSNSVARLVLEFKPDQIYFLAAYHHSSQDQVASDQDLWRESWNVNVDSFSNFLEAARRSEVRPHIFYASSSRIFGDASTSLQTETSAVKPTCLYGITKATGMQLAHYYRYHYGLHVSCGILFNHESPLRNSRFLSQRVVEGLAEIKIGRSKRLEIGSLDARADWGYAPDYTRAMQLILEANFCEDYVIASGATHSVRDWIEIASEEIEVDWQAAVVETPQILTRRPQSLCGDTSRLRQATNWEPNVSFKEMVGMMAVAALKRATAKSS